MHWELNVKENRIKKGMPQITSFTFFICGSNTSVNGCIMERVYDEKKF